MVEVNFWGSYWRQQASPAVTAAVLVGGLLSAFILFILGHVELGAQAFATNLGLVSHIPASLQ